MKTLRLANTIVSMLVKERLFYPGRLLADTVVVFARFGIVALLYRYVFELRGGEILGVSFQAVAWSMFFYFAFMVFGLRTVAREIMRDVQSGTVEVLFSKPVSYLWYRAMWQIGTGLYPFIFISVLGSVVLAYTIGIPATLATPLFLSTIGVVLILGIVLMLLLYISIGLLAFWMEDVNPVFWIVDKAVMILGGSYLPIALFPPLMYQIALWSPFGAAYFITHSVYASWATLWLKLISIQAFWIAILCIVVATLFAFARRKVSVNGG